MTSLDTNVLVRLLTRDDPAQAEAAAAVLRAGPTWVSVTVLLATEWVLRFTYGFEREAVARALTALLGLETLEVEARDVVRRAVTWHGAGLDLAAALHLAAAPDAVTEMVTFDRSFARRAARVGAVPAVRVLRA